MSDTIPQVDELFKVQREWNLAHAVNTLAAKSRIVSYYPLGQLRADQDENVYFVTVGLFAPLLPKKKVSMSQAAYVTDSLELPGKRHELHSDRAERVIFPVSQRS